MAALNGWWFIGVGILVFIVSSFQEGMQFFMYISYGFFAYGGLKILMSFFKQKEEQLTKVAPTQQKTYYCNNCGRILLPEDNFCPNCGMVLR